ncbi:Hypothetical protein I5071_92420 [Sandaracinus amylolyticus]|nr:Hypothetical protein I5071_92420 [Sandaracinus amylolyticus]
MNTSETQPKTGTGRVRPMRALDRTGSRERLVVIGNGMAGIRCLDALLERAPERFDVTVFSAEARTNYDRIQLSGVLLGEKGWDDVVLNDDAWYEERGITLHLGAKVARIDRERRVVVGENGIEAPYDKILYATGSRAFVLPVPGRDLDGVYVFRTYEDCGAMIDRAKTSKRAAVIGGGLLGLEAARGLAAHGLEVTVVHLVSTLMERQLDAAGGEYLRRAIEQQGVKVALGKKTEEILADDEGRVRGLRFADGTTLDAEIVVMAAGIVPNAELAKSAGIDCRRGVLVDDFLRTSDPDVYAVGECVEHRGLCYGLVAPLYEMGRVAAAHLAGETTAAYEGSVVSTKLKVSGVDVFSAGDPFGDGACEIVRAEDSSAGVYKKVLFRDGRAVGAVLVGDATLSGSLDALVKGGTTVEGPRAAILFPELAGAGGAAASPDAAVAAMPDSATICACNGVAKGTVLCAIRDQGLTTRKEVAACTNASRSCGGCGPQVESLIRLVHGDVAAKPSKKTLCDCTPLSREEVIEAIHEQHLTSVRETMSVLGWTGDGCATCRPAINYYLTVAWPGENEDDPRSRFVNERVHANIQRDGTYSVVPRMYGGVTTPDELMRIAQVAKRFHVPTVKVTGGQRIDLLGVKKEDLPAVWKALDMPSGFAYAKGVRTVKTCVGSTWCRFGTRDSMGFGIRIERTFENLWTPAKVKMAVNACPRNCAESLVKDVGLIAGETEWEIYVGGNGGIKVRTAELLAKVETDDEAMDLIAAFLQLYREDATYGERTAHWVERVGIESIRKRVVDDLENRAALVDRMEEALDARVEPWRERVTKLESGDEEMEREFAPLRLKLRVVA